MQCPKCRSEIPAWANFCLECDTPIWSPPQEDQAAAEISSSGAISDKNSPLEVEDFAPAAVPSPDFDLIRSKRMSDSCRTDVLSQGCLENSNKQDLFDHRPGSDLGSAWNGVDETDRARCGDPFPGANPPRPGFNFSRAAPAAHEQRDLSSENEGLPEKKQLLVMGIVLLGGLLLYAVVVQSTLSRHFSANWSTSASSQPETSLTSFISSLSAYFPFGKGRPEPEASEHSQAVMSGGATGLVDVSHPESHASWNLSVFDSGSEYTRLARPMPPAPQLNLSTEPLDPPVPLMDSAPPPGTLSAKVSSELNRNGLEVLEIREEGEGAIFVSLKKKCPVEAAVVSKVISSVPGVTAVRFSPNPSIPTNTNPQGSEVANQRTRKKAEPSNRSQKAVRHSRTSISPPERAW